MSRNTVRSLLFAFVAMTIIMTACAPSATSTPQDTASVITSTQYIRVAAGLGKSLDLKVAGFATTGGYNLSSDCPSWLTLGSQTIDSYPSADVEGEFTCEATSISGDEVITLVYTVEIPHTVHYDLTATAVVSAGQESWISIGSNIPNGNGHYEYSNLPSWITSDDFYAAQSGLLKANAPADAVGQTFTIIVTGEDYVNLATTETITVTIIVQ
ncbi:hypothetical protein HYV64_02270 [Candidatus Shapirobacteria bacterium]|nr:hypothetical protein [Candidatus Shapirobacteria bacterium]